MREILFKAKRIDNGEWVEGFYFCMVHDDGRHIHHFIMPLGVDLSLGTPIEKIQVEIDADTICQYTGLTDKNGNKIWENDIVKTYNSQGQECHIEQIIWADYGLNEGWCSKGIKSLIKYDKRVFDTGFGKSDARKCEVIGNIFDNADLLKGEQHGEINSKK